MRWRQVKQILQVLTDVTQHYTDYLPTHCNIIIFSRLLQNQTVWKLNSEGIPPEKYFPLNAHMKNIQFSLENIENLLDWNDARRPLKGRFCNQ